MSSQLGSDSCDVVGINYVGWEAVQVKTKVVSSLLFERAPKIQVSRHVLERFSGFVPEGKLSRAQGHSSGKKKELFGLGKRGKNLFLLHVHWNTLFSVHVSMSQSGNIVALSEYIIYV